MMSASPISSAAYASEKHRASPMTSIVSGRLVRAARRMIRLDKKMAGHRGGPQEEDRPDEDSGHGPRGQARGPRGRDGRDRGEDDEAEDVVQDRGAEDDLRLARLRDAEVLQHSRRDAHARRRERRADEDVGEGADRDADDQLAEDRGLPEALGREAPRFGAADEERQGEERRAEARVALGGGGRPRDRGRGEDEPRDCREPHLVNAASLASAPARSSTSPSLKR